MVQLAFAGVAHIHTPGFIKNILARQDVSVKSVWDPDAAKAAKRAGELKAKAVDDLDSIFGDLDVEGIIVCSQTNLHEQIVLPGAAAGKHLFVEKPLGFAARDGWRMAAAIEKAGVLFQTGYFMRGDPKHIFLKEQIAKGTFGKITRIRGSNCHSGALGRWFDEKPNDPASSWRWMAEPKIAGVGAFGDLGTHSLDIMLWLLGEVSMATGQIDNGTAVYPGCDETGEGLMRFKNGAIGTLAAAWDDLTNPVSLLISGTEGHAVIINGQLFLNSKHIQGADGKQPWTNLPPARPAGLDAFLNAVAGVKDQALVTAREAAYRSAVMEAMYEGARTNAWVEVSH